MPSRIREEERNEKIIRGLLKLPENRRCINCNSLGPQYVCTTFWTFVCTNCSGVHREFTHRVKSVSMAKFSAEEVTSLQAGGNEQAREVFFKTWDPQIYPLPNGSNLLKLRNFIKHVYVERRFTGEKSSDKLVRLKKEFRDGFFEKPSHDRYCTGLRDEHSGSCPRGGHEPRILRTFVADSSPQYQENGSSRARRTRSCARFEIVDERFRNDSHGDVRCHECHRFSGSLHRGLSLSPDLRKSSEITPWEVRSVEENRGVRIPSLKLGDSTKEKNKFQDNTHAEKAAETSNPASTNGKQEEQKAERSSSIIDTEFKADAEPESSGTSDSSNKHKIVPSSNGGDSSSLPSTQQNSLEKGSKPRSVNSVEALLLELATPGPVAVPATPAPLPCGANTSETAPNMGSILAVPSSGGGSSVEVGNGKQFPETKQCQPSASLTVDGSSADERGSLPIEASSNQNLSPSPAPNLQAQALSNQVQLSWPSPASTSKAQSSSNQARNSATTSEAQTSSNQNTWPSPGSNSQTASNSQSAPNSEVPVSLNPSSGPLSHGLAHASIPAARNALPTDVFMSPYFYPASVPYGQFRPPQQMGMGMGMQMGASMHYIPNAMQPPGLAHGSKSKNPFDIEDGAPQAQNTMFPCMVAMQGTRPPLSAQMGVQPQPSPHTFAFNHQQLPSYGTAQMPSYGTATSLGVDSGQPPSNSMLVPRSEENNKTDNVEDVFASLNPLQSMSRSQTNTKGGNPFG